MQQGNTGNVYYIIPEAQCFTRDDNWLTLYTGDESALGNVSIEIWNITMVTQWDTLRYSCSVDRLRVSLNHVIAYVRGKGLDEFYWRAYVGNTMIVSQGQRIIDGQTLATRTHAAESVMILGNVGDTIDVWMPLPRGSVKIGNTIHAVNYSGVHTYTTNGETSIHVDLWDSVDTIMVRGTLGFYDKTSTQIPSGHGYDLYQWRNNSDPSDVIYSRVSWNMVRNGTPLYDSQDQQIGDAFVSSHTSGSYDRGEYFSDEGVTTQQEWDIELVYPCVREKKVVVEYVNTDGCKRYAVGQLLNVDQEVEQSQYHRVEDELRSIPRAKTNRVTQTLRVGFPKVPHGAFLEDILASESIVVTGIGASAKAICKTTKLGKIDDSDVIIELVVLN